MIRKHWQYQSKSLSLAISIKKFIVPATTTTATAVAKETRSVQLYTVAPFSIIDVDLGSACASASANMLAHEYMQV